jgi:hypothetical protein
MGLIGESACRYSGDDERLRRLSGPAGRRCWDSSGTHQDTVYNLCFQVLRQSQNAQDAAQQVLLSLLGALPKIYT